MYEVGETIVRYCAGTTGIAHTAFILDILSKNIFNCH